MSVVEGAIDEIGKMGIATAFAIAIMSMGQMSANYFKDFNHGSFSALILAPLGGVVFWIGMNLVERK